MDFTSPSDTSNGYQRDYLPVPDGWQIVPHATDSLAKNVIWSHNWGTDHMMTADGEIRFTRWWQGHGSWATYHYQEHHVLEQRGATYKPASCDTRILIQQCDR